MNLIINGLVVPAVAPDGSTEMSNFIDVLCACIVQEISTFGYAESVLLTPGSGTGSPVQVPDTLPNDGPNHIHAHLHTSASASALRFQTTSTAVPA
jgi:hypothetical protein